MRKKSLIILELFYAKNRLGKHQIFEKWDDFENRPSCKGYRLCKIVSLGQKLKLKKKKLAKNDSLIILQFLCAKNRLRKHQIFEKWHDFENRPSCKGYSFCKVVSLGEKLKSKERCERLFFNHIRVGVCQKPLEKTPNIREMGRFWKSAITQRLSPLQNSQFGSKLKLKKKNLRKTIL